MVDITSTITDAPLVFSRALRTSLGILPSVIAQLSVPRDLAAAPSVAPAVTTILTSPKALAAAMAASASVTTALSKPFNPADVGSLVAWFDMQDVANFTNTSGTVSQITNKVSGVCWTEAGVTQRPAVGTINGLPCMDFDGVNDRIMSTEAAVWQALDVGSDYTLFYVAAFDTLQRDDSAIAIANSGTSLGIRSWGQDTTGTGRFSVTTLTDAGASVKVTSTASSVPGAHVHCWHGSATQVSRQLNNYVTEDPSNAAYAPGAATSNRTALGCRPRSSPTLFFDGKIGEVLIYNTRLSAEARTLVAEYLRVKWAITPLQHVITQGDSITAGNTAGAVSIASLLTAPGAIITNVATGGRKATEVLAIDIDAEMVQFRSSGDVVSTLLIGTNDLANDGSGGYATSAQVLTTIAAIVARLRGLGMAVVTGTILYRQASGWGANPAFNTSVDVVNAAMKVGYTQLSTYLWANNGSGEYGDYVVDTNAAMVAAGGYALYLDSTHPNPTGTQALANVMQAGIDLALAA